MALQRLPLLLLLSLSLFASVSQAFTFSVGGKDGWVLHPSEDYNHWAGRNRFQVNDVLYFKYKKGDDSVLVVNKNDYSNCNIDKPVLKLDGGDSRFTFTRSGPFYFISGVKDHCLNGQKLIVVVLAVRHPRASPPTAPPPASHPPSHDPAAAPAPHAIVPSTSPTASSPPGPSPTAGASPSPSPSRGPAASPSPLSSGPASSPPAPPPVNPTPAVTPEAPHGGNATAPSSPPAGAKPPSPAKSAAAPMTASLLVMMPVTLALMMLLNCF